MNIRLFLQSRVQRLRRKRWEGEKKATELGGNLPQQPSRTGLAIKSSRGFGSWSSQGLQTPAGGVYSGAHGVSSLTEPMQCNDSRPKIALFRHPPRGATRFRSAIFCIPPRLPPRYQLSLLLVFSWPSVPHSVPPRGYATPRLTVESYERGRLHNPMNLHLGQCQCNHISPVLSHRLSSSFRVSFAIDNSNDCQTMVKHSQARSLVFFFH